MDNLTGSRKFGRDLTPRPSRAGTPGSIDQATRLVDPAGRIVGWLDRFGNPRPVRRKGESR